MKNTTAQEILEKHWKLKTDFPMDDVIKLNMQYCVESMQEYAKIKCQELLEIVSEKVVIKTFDGEKYYYVLDAVDLKSFCK